MEKITFHYTPKKDGVVRIRYRLRDGRGVQICHCSDIEADVRNIAKFEPTGFVKGNIRLYDAELADRLRNEYEIMLRAYAIMKENNYDITSDVFEREIQLLKNPQEFARKYSQSTIIRFRQYLDEQIKDGLIGEARSKHIKVVIDKMERCLLIMGKSSIIPQEFTDRDLLDFRNFLFDEYTYIEKYPNLYENIKEKNRPKARLSMNTVSSQLKMVQAFFNYLENRDEIVKSPFRRLGNTRDKIMKTKYDEPFYLTVEELHKVIATDVPEYLKDVKDTFLVHCAIGCRVGDFAKMDMSYVAITDDGIPYVHYIPSKTEKEQDDNSEIKTPLVKFAYEIIHKNGFCFPILRNLYGKKGYNSYIKLLLKICKIDRKVEVFDEEKHKNDYVPLYSVSSSKLCRRTHVDVMNKVQISMYASGLHKEGSAAVYRYSGLSIKDRFDLMNIAFKQSNYRIL